MTHHWIIEMTDEGIDEAERLFYKIISKILKADFFVFAIHTKEEKKVMLHRYVSASASGTISCIE